MILFFDFERLLYGQPSGAAELLGEVLHDYPDVSLVLTRWSVGGVRTLDEVRSVLPAGLAACVSAVAHRPVHSDVLREREISGTLRRTRQSFWAAVVPERLGGGYVELAKNSGAPLVLCRDGFNDEAAMRLRVGLDKVLEIEGWASGALSTHSQGEKTCCC